MHLDPRVRNDEPRDGPRRPAVTGINWSVALPVAVLVALLITFVTDLIGNEGGTSGVNAPSSTPPSVQQPDTSPSVNQDPAR